jgi:hypothetical protein
MAITSKKINLSQLDAELGSHGLIADFNDEANKIILPADGSSVTEDQLDKAIKAHVAGPSDEEIRLANKESGMAKLRELGLTTDQLNALLS